MTPGDLHTHICIVPKDYKMNPIRTKRHLKARYPPQGAIYLSQGLNLAYWRPANLKLKPPETIFNYKIFSVFMSAFLSTY